jgi:hypothetical protein
MHSTGDAELSQNETGVPDANRSGSTGMAMLDECSHINHGLSWHASAGTQLDSLNCPQGKFLSFHPKIQETS